jgi:predicted RND superfamily exporter protein
MEKREKLQELIIVFLKQKDIEGNPTAREIYEKIRHKNPTIFRVERVRNFRSFVKIINSFDEIESQGKKGYPRIYKVAS